METEINPFRAPRELTSDAPTKLGLRVSQYSNGILARRWAATSIDMICMFFAFITLHAALGDELHHTLLPLTLTCLALYFPLLEGLWGITLGKLAAGIKVVDYHGRRPGIRKALIRSLLRIIEGNPLLLGGLPAGIVAVLSPRKQRLGDILAGTLVVFRRDV